MLAIFHLLDIPGLSPYWFAWVVPLFYLLLIEHDVFTLLFIELVRFTTVLATAQCAGEVLLLGSDCLWSSWFRADVWNVDSFELLQVLVRLNLEFRQGILSAVSWICTTIIEGMFSSNSDFALRQKLLLFYFLFLQIGHKILHLWIPLVFFLVNNKRIETFKNYVKLRLSKELLDDNMNFVIKISLLLRRNLLPHTKFVIRLMALELFFIDCFNNDPVGYSFSSWKAAAVILNQSNDIIRMDVFVWSLLAERNDDFVLKIVEKLAIESLDKMLQFVSQGAGRHLLERKWSLCQHSYRFESMIESVLAFYMFD